MMKRTLLAIMGTVAAITLGAGAGPAAAVEVLRGGSHESVAAAPARRGIVQVVRGQPVSSTEKQRNEEFGRDGQIPGYFAASGSILWLVDTRSGRLTACSLGGSGIVGRDRIRCTRDR